MSFQRYVINIPENITDGTILVLNIILDTKEIEGGREELILKPPGNYEIETYRHTGREQSMVISTLTVILGFFEKKINDRHFDSLMLWFLKKFSLTFFRRRNQLSVLYAH